MARTKQTARKSPASPKPPPTGLLKLLGVPEGWERSWTSDRLEFVRSTSIDSIAIDWSAVKERLLTHPEEARIPLNHLSEKLFPLDIAVCNKNAQNPIPPLVLEALIAAHPDPAQDLRAVHLALERCASRPEIRAVLLKHNPYLCGEERTQTFQRMGFPASNRELYSHNIFGDNQIDWQALEQHLRDHPHEAKIPCRLGKNIRFPLEVAVQFSRNPVPLSTVRLLLELAPEVVADPRSLALINACSAWRGRPDGADLEAAEIARAILRANPELAGCPCSYEETDFEEQMGYPLHAITRVMYSCGADLASELLAAYPAAIGSRCSIHRNTPLELACEESSFNRRPSTDLLRTLLEAGHHFLLNGGDENYTDKCELEKGQMIFDESGYSDTPIFHLSRTWYGTDTLCVWNNSSRGLPPPPELANFFVEFPLEGLQMDWDNYCLGLQAAGAYETRLPSERMWEYPLLPAAIRFAYRDSFVTSLVQFHSTQEDLIRSDPRGITPLLAAVDRMIDGPGNPEDRHHDDEDFSCVSVLELLLKQAVVSSQASHDPGGGGFRLHRALRMGLGLEHGTRLIADAFPRALSMPDPETGLIPCLLAAVGENARVETIFHIMSRGPHLLASLCKEATQPGTAGTKRKIDGTASP